MPAPAALRDGRRRSSSACGDHDGRADYYELLGVRADADEATIKAAYRKLAMECHPDRHGGCTDKEAQFKAISEAYDVPEGPAEARRLRPLRPCRVPEWRRRRSVRRRAAASTASPTSSRRSSASSWTRAAQRAERGARRRPALRPRADAGGSVRRRREDHRDRGAGALRGLRRRRARKGHSARAHLRAPAAAPARSARSRASSWSSAAARPAMGSGETIADPCRACDGEGRALKRRKLSVNIPAGVDEGTRIRVAGEGEAGVRGAPRGDLYLFVHMKRHADLRARGHDAGRRMPGQLHHRGARRLDRHSRASTATRIEIKIPAGIQSGEQLRQRGAGMSVLNGRGRGDLVTRILVETPTKLIARSRRRSSRNSARPRPATNARRARASSAGCKTIFGRLGRSAAAVSSSRIAIRIANICANRSAIARRSKPGLRADAMMAVGLRPTSCRRSISGSDIAAPMPDSRKRRRRVRRRRAQQRERQVERSPSRRARRRSRPARASVSAMT